MKFEAIGTVKDRFYRHMLETPIDLLGTDLVEMRIVPAKTDNHSWYCVMVDQHGRERGQYGPHKDLWDAQSAAEEWISELEVAQANY